MRVAVRPFHYQVGPRHMRRGMYGLGLENCDPQDSACVARNQAEDAVDVVRNINAQRAPLYDGCVSSALENGVARASAESSCGAQYGPLPVPTKEQVLAGNYTPPQTWNAPVGSTYHAPTATLPAGNAGAYNQIAAMSDKECYDMYQSGMQTGSQVFAGWEAGMVANVKAKAARYLNSLSTGAPASTVPAAPSTSTATAGSTAQYTGGAQQQTPPGNVGTGGSVAVADDTIFGISKTTLMYLAAFGVGAWLLMRGQKG